MRFAYADPPYIGQAAKHYRNHPDYAGEVDHEALIAHDQCSVCHVPIAEHPLTDACGISVDAVP